MEINSRSNEVNFLGWLDIDTGILGSVSNTLRNSINGAFKGI